MRSITKAENDYWYRLCAEIGCIACRIDGRFNNFVSIHHIDGRTKPGCHKKVLPLCSDHHQTGGKEAPSIHPWKARFEKKYGKQMDLNRMCNEILAQTDYNIKHGVR